MTVNIHTGFQPEIDGEVIGASGLRYDAFLRDVKELRGVFGPTGRAVISADKFNTMQAAIDALPAAGGTVLIPPGYTENITTGIIPVDNLAIICPSCDAVITDTVGNLTTGMIPTYSGATAFDDVLLYGLNLVGTGVGSTSVGIYADYSPERWRIERCSLTGINIGIAGSDRGGLVDIGFIDSVIAHCKITAVNYIGIYVIAFKRVKIGDCYVNGDNKADFGVYVRNSDDVIADSIHSFNCQYDGFRVGLNNRTHLEFRSCKAYRNRRSGFITTATVVATEVTPIFIACTARENYTHGFWLLYASGKPGGAVCIACRAIDNSYTHANVSSGFYLSADTERVSLIGCEGYKKNRSEQKYGFEIAAGASKCEVRGGRWSPNQTGSWLDNGTDTIIDARDD